MSTTRQLPTLLHIQTVQIERAVRWHQGQRWSVLEWGGAMAGECGEAVNVAKKLRRAEQGLNNRRKGTTAAEQVAELRPKLLEECGDTIAYMLLLLADQGLTADDLLAEVVR